MSYPKLHLWRKPFRDGHPTQGIFMWESAKGIFRHVYVKCLELPWMDNVKGKSCIPPGEPKAEITYRMSCTHSPKYGRKMWLVEGVDGRSGIRIHSGNFAGVDKSDSLGCLLPCLNWEDIDKDGDIDGVSSRIATQRLESELRPYEKTGIDLVIRNG